MSKQISMALEHMNGHQGSNINPKTKQMFSSGLDKFDKKKVIT
ncbi:hypothetical protein [Pseudobacillus badius]|nr:hypothetical protein [Bacillus badius]GLY12508.1 hypothetical protein Bbad01_37240 [Bacillus badius]